jgi:hypothetical protein
VKFNCFGLKVKIKGFKKTLSCYVFSCELETLGEGKSFMLSIEESSNMVKKLGVLYLYKQTYQYFSEREVMEVRYLVKHTDKGNFPHDTKEVLKSDIKYIPVPSLPNGWFEKIKVEPITNEYKISDEDKECLMDKKNLFDINI